MTRWILILLIVLSFSGLILAGWLHEVSYLAICLPFNMLAVFLWWAMMKNSQDMRDAKGDKRGVS